MKLVELEILKISYLGNFSSFYMFFEVILETSLKSKNFGGCYRAPANHGRAARDMGTGEPPWPSASFQARRGRQLLVRVTARAGRLRVGCLSYKAPRCHLLPFFSVLPSLPPSSAACCCHRRVASG
jgi:hypothetical protein